MNRRKLLATTGAVSLTAAAAVVAMGANIGLFGLTDTGTDVGRFQPVTATSSTTTPPTVLYLDVQDPPAATPGVAGGSADGPANGSSRSGADPAPSASTPPPTSASPDHEGDDDSYHEESDEAEHELEHGSEHDDD
jgi:hypothetical protein